jgi:hypothetical protein
MSEAKIESRDYRHGEALRILGGLSEAKANLCSFGLSDQILMIHIFRAGEIRTPTADQLKRLQDIERNFFKERRVRPLA